LSSPPLAGTRARPQIDEDGALGIDPRRVYWPRVLDVSDRGAPKTVEETYLGGEMTCNGYGGSPDRGGYRTTKNGELGTGMIAMTVEACPTPKGVLEQEAAYVEALRAATRYRVSEDRLEMLDASGATTLVFE